MYKPKMKKSEVTQKAIELSLESYVENENVSTEELFDRLRDMFLYYESEVQTEEAEAQK